jgi:hypothetical protein
MPLMDTNACIDHFSRTSDVPRNLLEQTIPPAIDAAWKARYAGKYTHEIGASAAVAALQAAEVDAMANESPKWREELVESHDAWMHRAKGAEFYLFELLGLVLDDMAKATVQDLACDGPVGDEEGKVWARIEALAEEARMQVFSEAPV